MPRSASLWLASTAERRSKPRIANLPDSPVVRDRRPSGRHATRRAAIRAGPIRPEPRSAFQAARRRSAHQVTTPEVARLSIPPIRMSMGISAAGQFLMLMKTGTM